MKGWGKREIPGKTRRPTASHEGSHSLPDPPVLMRAYAATACAVRATVAPLRVSTNNKPFSTGECPRRRVEYSRVHSPESPVFIDMLVSGTFALAIPNSHLGLWNWRGRMVRLYVSSGLERRIGILATCPEYSGVFLRCVQQVCWCEGRFRLMPTITIYPNDKGHANPVTNCYRLITVKALPIHLLTVKGSVRDCEFPIGRAAAWHAGLQALIGRRRFATSLDARLQLATHATRNIIFPCNIKIVTAPMKKIVTALVENIPTAPVNTGTAPVENIATAYVENIAPAPNIATASVNIATVPVENIATAPVGNIATAPVNSATAPVENIATAPVGNIATAPVGNIATAPVNTATAPVENIATAPVENIVTAPVGKIATVPVNTATAPVENIATAPVENIVTAPMENTATAPVENTATAPVENIATAPMENSVTAPVGKIATAPVENIATAPVENIATAPVENIVTAPVGKIATAPVENIATALWRTLRPPLPCGEHCDRPCGEHCDRPVENIVTAPVENIATAPVENIVTAPVGNIVTAPVENIVTAPVGNIATAPVGNTATAPVGNIATAPVENIATALWRTLRPPLWRRASPPLYCVTWGPRDWRRWMVTRDEVTWERGAKLSAPLVVSGRRRRKSDQYTRRLWSPRWRSLCPSRTMSGLRRRLPQSNKQYRCQAATSDMVELRFANQRLGNILTSWQAVECGEFRGKQTNRTMVNGNTVASGTVIAVMENIGNSLQHCLQWQEICIILKGLSGATYLFNFVEGDWTKLDPMAAALSRPRSDDIGHSLGVVKWRDLIAATASWPERRTTIHTLATSDEYKTRCTTITEQPHAFRAQLLAPYKHIYKVPGVKVKIKIICQRSWLRLMTSKMADVDVTTWRPAGSCASIPDPLVPDFPKSPLIYTHSAILVFSFVICLYVTAGRHHGKIQGRVGEGDATGEIWAPLDPRLKMRWGDDSSSAHVPSIPKEHNYQSLKVDNAGRATVAERLACSPSTKAIWVQSTAGSLRIFLFDNRRRRCRWSAGFLSDLPFPPPFHSGVATYSPQSPSSALKTTVLRAEVRCYPLYLGVAPSGSVSRPSSPPSLAAPVTQNTARYRGANSTVELLSRVCGPGLRLTSVPSHRLLSDVSRAAFRQFRFCYVRVTEPVENRDDAEIVTTIVDNASVKVGNCKTSGSRHPDVWVTSPGYYRDEADLNKSLWRCVLATKVGNCKRSGSRHPDVWVTSPGYYRDEADLNKTLWRCVLATKVGDCKTSGSRHPGTTEMKLTSTTRLHHRGSKLDLRSYLRSRLKTVAPFEFRARLEIEIKLISNRRNWRNLDTRSAAIRDLRRHCDICVCSHVCRLPQTRGRADTTLQSAVHLCTWLLTRYCGVDQTETIASLLYLHTPEKFARLTFLDSCAWADGTARPADTGVSDGPAVYKLIQLCIRLTFLDSCALADGTARPADAGVSDGPAVYKLIQLCIVKYSITLATHLPRFLLLGRRHGPARPADAGVSDGPAVYKLIQLCIRLTFLDSCAWADGTARLADAGVSDGPAVYKLIQLCIRLTFLDSCAWGRRHGTARPADAGVSDGPAVYKLIQLCIRLTFLDSCSLADGTARLADAGVSDGPAVYKLIQLCIIPAPGADGTARPPADAGVSDGPAVYKLIQLCIRLTFLDSCALADGTARPADAGVSDGPAVYKLIQLCIRLTFLDSCALADGTARPADAGVSDGPAVYKLIQLCIRLTFLDSCALADGTARPADAGVSDGPAVYKLIQLCIVKYSITLATHLPRFLRLGRRHGPARPADTGVSDGPAVYKLIQLCIRLTFLDSSAWADGTARPADAGVSDGPAVYKLIQLCIRLTFLDSCALADGTARPADAGVSDCPAVYKLIQLCIRLTFLDSCALADGTARPAEAGVSDCPAVYKLIQLCIRLTFLDSCAWADGTARPADAGVSDGPAVYKLIQLCIVKYSITPATHLPRFLRLGPTARHGTARPADAGVSDGPAVYKLIQLCIRLTFLDSCAWADGTARPADAGVSDCPAVYKLIQLCIIPALGRRHGPPAMLVLVTARLLQADSALYCEVLYQCLKTSLWVTLPVVSLATTFLDSCAWPTAGGPAADAGVSDGPAVTSYSALPSDHLPRFLLWADGTAGPRQMLVLVTAGCVQADSALYCEVLYQCLKTSLWIPRLADGTARPADVVLVTARLLQAIQLCIRLTFLDSCAWPTARPARPADAGVSDGRLLQAIQLCIVKYSSVFEDFIIPALGRRHGRPGRQMLVLVTAGCVQADSALYCEVLYQCLKTSLWIPALADGTARPADAGVMFEDFIVVYFACCNPSDHFLDSCLATARHGPPADAGVSDAGCVQADSALYSLATHLPRFLRLATARPPAADAGVSDGPAVYKLIQLCIIPARADGTARPGRQMLVLVTAGCVQADSALYCEVLYQCLKTSLFLRLADGTARPRQMLVLVTARLLQAIALYCEVLYQCLKTSLWVYFACCKP
ncbi:hypothetical protein PR048_020685 [Dryococelus australis]|uniref:Uncharacterized protein n=1 Tax=Dryococelus australis TaxID=614101 RepID=A0ABQ9H722_9NEOP|nr:hypothetical protein PR048_020685 [Dryococelus australis]